MWTLLFRDGSTKRVQINPGLNSDKPDGLDGYVEGDGSDCIYQPEYQSWTAKHPFQAPEE